MHAQTSVDARTLYAEHDAQVDRGPGGLGTRAVGTDVVARGIQEVKAERVTVRDDGKEGGRRVE